MPIRNNLILRKGIPILLISALMTTGLFSCQNVAYAETVVLSEQTYYHLDMGVQVAYNEGCDWGSDNIYGSAAPLTVNTTISFNNDVEVLDTYPLEGAKGSNFNFNGATSSDNIPSGLGAGDSAYDIYYANYVSSLITEGNCNSNGKDIAFNYTVKLNTSTPLEVVEFGRYGNDQEIYQLFGGKAALENDQPEIADAIATALKAGRDGTAGTNKMYLIFCPNVIVYKKYITVGDLEAKLDLPSTAKQGETYTATDVSSIDGSLTVRDAVLERRDDEGNWQEVAVWDGTGIPCRNTGGSVSESSDEIGTITYRLTVTTTNDQVDTDTKTIQITDGREIDGEAILELPAFTYEGHPALAKDCSVFSVDGVDYSARRAYEEGVADNEFHTLPSSAGNASRESLTTANVVFPKRGNYNVRLDIDTVSGTHLTDIKPITVRKTPYIIDNLGGFQKQNRKQILDIAVATYPGKPITEYSVELTDLKTGQSITLTESLPQQNNATIKTRPITRTGDTYWTNFQLLFLTKNTTSQEYRYTIYMKDSKGDTDTVQKTFTVAPDLPPDAQIAIQDSFIRSKGTNIAEIEAEDVSMTDGDQLQRTWTIKGIGIRSLPGFQDRSFGSGQKVKYDKTGVGKETISLFVKDVWTEPTLEEYVSADDYLSATAEAIAEVINIAPTVRLEPIDTQEADIAILTTKASKSAIEAGMNNIRAALIEAGIDANLQIIPTAIPDQGGYRRTGYVEWPVSINCGTCQSTGLVFDSDYAYRVVSASRTVSGYQEVCTDPHTIYAMDADGNSAWSYTVNEFANFQIALDQQEKYLYIISSGDNKTVLLNRKNGAYLTTLDVALPSGTIVLQDKAIYILTGSNIQRYDPATGTLGVAAKVGGSLGRLQNGEITFVMQESAFKFNIASFDPVNETVTYRSIPQLEEYNWSPASSIYPTDMDTTGKVTFTQTLSYDNDIVGVCLWLSDAENGKVYNLGRVANLSDGRANSVGFVKDETGKAMFIYHGMGDDDSTSATTRHYYYLNVYTLGDGDDSPVLHGIYGGRNNSINYWGSVSYAQYYSDENAIYLMMGAAWQGYDWGGNASGIMCKIQIPSWSIDFNQYGWGWDAADEYGAYNDSLSATYYSYDNWIGMTKRVKLFRHSITAEHAIEYALDKFANFRDSVACLIERNYTAAQALTEKVEGAVKEKTSLGLAISDGGPVDLSKSFRLIPGRTYYYEYEVKKPDGDGEDEPGKIFVTAPQVTFDTQAVYYGSGNLESYYVTDIIEEDFNNGLDPFFTLDSGRLTDGLQTPTTQKYGSSRDLGVASQISFTIPEGKTAVAVMDVTGYNGALNGAGWRSGAYINGQRYDKLPMTDLSVTGYVHPYPLKAGTNTIMAYACDRSRQIDAVYTKIDNLKILFLEKTPDASGNSFTSAKTEDGWTKVAGSFKAPEKITEFRSQEMTHCMDWPPEFTTSVNGNYTYYNFAIPAGKIGRVHATFQGSTSRSNTSAGTFVFPGWSINHRGTRSASNGVLQYVESGETHFAGDAQGAAVFTAMAGYQRYAGFSKLETHIYPENLRDKNTFFFADNKVYSLSNSFAGESNINIRLNSDGADTELLLQNLKIYYMNNGSKVYLYNKPLQNTEELSGWTISNNAAADMHTEAKAEKEEDAPLVYKKGQLVSYNIFYDDYEKDPSKKQYWRYSHTPMNDGPNPQAAFILDEEGNVVSSTGAILPQAIPRFYIDGKYTVEHWQEDNTNRTGDISGTTDYTEYDKLSNVETLTFYIEGGGAAPWITSISTLPKEVKEGDNYQLVAGVDDAEKDELRLTTELFKDKKLIYTHRRTNITADENGIYPRITTGFAPLAEPGKYEAVCTVRDWSGAGIGSYRFTVVSEGKIDGFVNHTDQWDENRKKYNLKRFDEEGNRTMQIGDYSVMPMPRLRGTNVFWSGEKFMLRSEIGGKPSRVEVQIVTISDHGIRNNTGYTTELSNSGSKTPSGDEIWEGSLWDQSMINRWGRKTPQQLVFLFTAYYAGGVTKTSEVTVIIDSDRDYWQLHRLW